MSKRFLDSVGLMQYHNSIVQALNKKADVSTVYIKTEVDKLLDDKLDFSTASAALAAKANSADVYTKTEADELLNAKANAADVYTKANVDELLNAKVNAANVYSKTEADELLGSKANTTDVYTKMEVDDLLASITVNNVYTKTEVNNLLSSKANTVDVSSEINTINDEIESLNTRIDELPSALFKIANRHSLTKNGYVDVSSYMSTYNELMIIVRIETDGDTKIGLSNSSSASNSGFLCSVSTGGSTTTYYKIMMNKTDEGYYAWEFGSSIGWTSSTGYKYIRNYSSAASTISMSVVIHGR